MANRPRPRCGSTLWGWRDTSIDGAETARSVVRSGVAMADPLTGRRRPDSDDSMVGTWEPGDYGPIYGEWYVCLPNGDFCNINRWTITEHEDGTITAEPSINSVGRWHGWLRRGVFTLAAQQ